MDSWKTDCKKNRRMFAVLLLMIEVLMVVMYSLFVRTDTTEGMSVAPNNTYYPMYQDVNLMMLIGFGFLMTFIRTNSWSALCYTFMINAVVVQLYLLLQPFWHHVFSNQAWTDSYRILLKEPSFTAASYSVASILIAYGAVLGKIGPLEMLIMGIVGIVGYTINEDLVYSRLRLFDAGGSTAIHTFGAFYGLMVSLLLGRYASCKKQPKTNSTSINFAMIGTVYLWMFWPSFNAGYFPTNQVEKTLIITNTILSLTGSCLGTFFLTTFVRGKFNMEDILNASLAGGVIIGAPAGIITNPLASLLIGFCGGSLSTLMFAKLSAKMHEVMGLHDTCGVNNLHGIPGFLGGLLSAVIIASYGRYGVNSRFQNYVPWSQKMNEYQRGYVSQAGAQVAGTFLSAAVGIFTGIVAGIIILCFYSHKNDEHFFEDSDHFQIEQSSENMNKKINNKLANESYQTNQQETFM